MKAKLSRQTQFGKRVGIHSLTGFARAFAEMLPPQAVGYEFQRRTLREIVDTLVSESRRLTVEITQCMDPLEAKRLGDCRNVIAGKLGMIRKEIPECNQRTYAEVFVVVAQIWLNQEAYYYIRDMTHSIVNHVHDLEREQQRIDGTDKIKAIIQDHKSRMANS